MTVLLNHWIILELSVALIRLVAAGPEIGVRQIAQSDWSTLENRLGMVIGQAFERSTLRRLGIDTGASLNTNKPIILFGHDNDSATEDGPNKTNEARPISGSPFRVQVLSIEEQLKGGIRVDFVVLLHDNPIPGNVGDIRPFIFTLFLISELQIVAGDLSLLSLSHISAVLQYPVTSIGSEYRSEQIEVSRWWIIAIIAGSGLLVALCGWGLLFIYFNTCGRPLIPTRPNHKFSNDITKVTEEDSAVDQNNISKDDNRQKSLNPGNTVARDTQG
ncbi:hypothetical protein Ddc_00744 [Ditylenchus destructor]|nr:hypothetical protein Ddc_00744 [Ditylenchus destructor]